MANKARNERPRGLRPTKTIELSEDHIKKRWFFVAAFLVLGLVAFGIFINDWLTDDPGWVEIEVSASELHCGEDFIFSYYIGGSDLSPTDEKKQVTALYSQAAVQAYRLFDRHTSYEGTVNLHTLNASPNQTHTVDPVLYNALSLLEREGGRLAYLGALAAEYGSSFYGQEDPYAAEWNPYVNAEFAAYCQRLADFARDPASVQLELGENFTVTLRVSEEYLAFARENDISVFVDLHRMKNAFVIDYFADLLAKNGFTNGCISSYDGYVRNLDRRGISYSLNLFSLRGVEVYSAARMEYSQPGAMVSLRAYPLGEKDAKSFCTLPDGKIITPYLDPADGLYRSAVNELVTYTAEMGCAELLLRMLPIYTADTLNGAALEGMTEAGIFWVWFEDTVIRKNDPNLVLKDLYGDEEITYTIG